MKHKDNIELDFGHSGTHPRPAFEILVNEHGVIVNDNRMTGRDIKQAAVDQGVPIQVDFVLSEEQPNGRPRIIGDDEVVTVNKHSKFRGGAACRRADSSGPCGPGRRSPGGRACSGRTRPVARGPCRRGKTPRNPPVLGSWSPAPGPLIQPGSHGTALATERSSMSALAVVCWPRSRSG